MKFFKYIFLSLAILAVSCKNDSQKAKDATDLRDVATTDTFSDMSIFNLPSNWTTQDGEDMELKDLQGKVLAMVMIYTSCQAACPRLVDDMHNIEQQSCKDIEYQLLYVFDSNDAEVDTQDRLKAFANENKIDSDEWLFLRGSEEDTREFAAVLAVNYRRITPIDFSHSNIISIFDKEGEMVHQMEGLGVDSKETIQAIIDHAQ